MEAFSQVETSTTRFSPHIEELRSFFAVRALTFGTPADLIALSEMLSEPGSFRDEMCSMVRSIILREGGSIPLNDLLSIVTEAIGGGKMAQSAQQYAEPVHKILSFLSGIMRKSWGMPPEQPNISEQAVGGEVPELPETHQARGRFAEMTAPEPGGASAASLPEPISVPAET